MQGDLPRSAPSRTTTRVRPACRGLSGRFMYASAMKPASLWVITRETPSMQSPMKCRTNCLTLPYVRQLQTAVILEHERCPRATIHATHRLHLAHASFNMHPGG